MTCNIDKYLSHYAEAEITCLIDFPSDVHFQDVVVIPAYKETDQFIKRFFNSVLAQQNILVIVVLNQPEQDQDLSPQQQLWSQCVALGTVNWQQQSMVLLSINSGNSSLLLVDRFNEPIPVKQGVGLARKIGTDIGLYLMAKNVIHSRWLYSTDADAHLPTQYFSCLSPQPKTVVAACFSFYHHSDNHDIHQANKIYEQALNYYVAGLKYANSAYAFFTIGSILAFDGNAYAMARGFPKRSAGEDFYLLNKIAKLGAVEFIDSCQIKITARKSDRVPFGTGPAVSRILSLQHEGKPYCYYHPQVFELLKVTLVSFNSLWSNRMQFELWLLQLPLIVQKALKNIGLDGFVAKQKTAKQQQFNKQLTVWFDAFKTLKFIHDLRVQGMADIPLDAAIKQANFTI